MPDIEIDLSTVQIVSLETITWIQYVSLFSSPFFSFVSFVVKMGGMEIVDDDDAMSNSGDCSWGASIMIGRDDSDTTGCNGLPITPSSVRMLGQFQSLVTLSHPHLVRYHQLIRCVSGESVREWDHLNPRFISQLTMWCC
jgi:hypothetical protein